MHDIYKLVFQAIRDACKKTIAHILSFQDKGWGEGRQNQNCLQKPKNELLFYDTSGSKKIKVNKIASLLGKPVIRSKLGDVLNIQAEVM